MNDVMREILEREGYVLPVKEARDLEPGDIVRTVTDGTGKRRALEVTNVYPVTTGNTMMVRAEDIRTGNIVRLYPKPDTRHEMSG